MSILLPIVNRLKILFIKQGVPDALPVSYQKALFYRRSLLLNALNRATEKAQQTDLAWAHFSDPFDA